MSRSLARSRLLAPTETHKRQSKSKIKAERGARSGAAVPSLESGRRRGVERGREHVGDHEDDDIPMELDQYQPKPLSDDQRGPRRGSMDVCGV
jgi:hypothetical protein